MVCAETNRQDAMLGGAIDEGAMMTSQKTPNLKKGVRKCTHCNGDNHVVDTCFKLYGYPDWHQKGKNVSQVSSSSKVDDFSSKGNLTTAIGFAVKSEHPYQGEDWQW